MRTLLRVFSIMFQDKSDVSMRRGHGSPSALDRAVDALVRQQGEFDIRRKLLFDDATRRQAAAYEEKSRHHSTTQLRYLLAVQEPIDLFGDNGARKHGPASGASGEESDEPLGAHNGFALAVEATVDQSKGVTVPFPPTLELDRTRADHAGLFDSLDRSRQTRVVGTPIAMEGHDFPIQKLPDRLTGDDPITLLAPKYTSPLDGLSGRMVSAREIAPHDTGFASALIDTLKLNQVYHQDEIEADGGDFLHDNGQDRGRVHGFRSTQISDPRTLADQMITNDLAHDRVVGVSAIGSDFRGIGDLFGQGDQRVRPGRTLPTIDRVGVWTSDDGPPSTTATSGAVQEAMAAAADELERLRTAVRQTIDELERARGSVQAPLPAVPVNRGAFRIS